MGLFSSSKSSTSNQTFNTDTRLAVQDGFGFSNSNGNSIEINTLDGGIVGRALDSVDRTTAAMLGINSDALAASRENTAAALDFANQANARALETVDTTLNDGFSRLLDISKDLFVYGGDLIDQTQSTVAAADMDAQNTAKGTIDNRTIIVLAVAAAAALVLMTRKG